MIFGKRFIGIFPISGTVGNARGVPHLKEGEVAILNRNVHWFTAFKKNGKLYESDSYNIDELGPKYADWKVDKTWIQKPGETNCGQRAILNTAIATAANIRGSPRLTRARRGS